MRLSMKEIKSQNIHELADAYGVTTHTMKAWIRPIKESLGDCIARMYNPKQIKMIYEFLGEPNR